MRHALGQACMGPAAPATALGVVGIIHHQECSVPTWATTLAALAAAAGVMMVAAVAEYQ